MNFRSFFTKDIKRAFVLFIFVNVSLYLFILVFHNKVDFNKFNYLHNSHHYRHDARIKGNDFKLINSIAQYDAQWYLKIAKKGYPKVIKEEKNPLNRSTMTSASYAFFPLYPIALSGISGFMGDIELSAFFFSNLLLFLNFGSIIFVIKKTISEGVAIKTALLLFLFPFSIFYRSYFTESLFLFILIWYAYFLIRKDSIKSSILFGLLNITRGSAVLLYLPHTYFLLKDFKEKNISLGKLLVSVALSIAPLGVWGLFNYLQTGNFLYFMKIRAEWIDGVNMVDQFVNNLKRIATPDYQDLHLFDSSQIDILIVFSVFVILISSFKVLPRKLWLISLCLFLSPLFFNNLMSYSRMQIVSFPLFLYLAMTLKGKWFILTAGAFAVGLFIVSIYFVNWHWIG